MAAEVNTVYLSKSNHANPDHVMKVRQWLDEKGFTVIEHKGGEYDESLLKQAKIMVMVGCNPVHRNTTGVGRGQYNQLSYRKQLGMEANYYVTGSYHGNSILRCVTLGGILDKDNWTNGYGALRIKAASTVRISTVHEPIEKKSINPVHSVDEYDPKTGKYPLGTVSGKRIIPRKIHLACITLFNT